MLLFYELVKISVVLSHHILKHALDAEKIKIKTVRND